MSDYHKKLSKLVFAGKTGQEFRISYWEQMAGWLKLHTNTYTILAIWPFWLEVEDEYEKKHYILYGCIEEAHEIKSK